MIPRVEVDRNASIRARTPGIAVGQYTVYYTHPREQRRTDVAMYKVNSSFCSIFERQRRTTTIWICLHTADSTSATWSTCAYSRWSIFLDRARGWLYLYLTRCREGLFPETGLPALYRFSYSSLPSEPFLQRTRGAGPGFLEAAVPTRPLCRSHSLFEVGRTEHMGGPLPQASRRRGYREAYFANLPLCGRPGSASVGSDFQPMVLSSAP